MNEWFCMKCGRRLIEVKLDEGEFPSCIHCKIRYTIHGTGAEGSLFIAAADELKITF